MKPGWGRFRHIQGMAVTADPAYKHCWATLRDFYVGGIVKFDHIIARYIGELNFHRLTHQQTVILEFCA